MNIKNQSSNIVIDSGRKQANLLENSLYLHNFIGNYEEIGGKFSRVDISLMDALWKKIIDQQKREEQKIYSLLGITGIDQLNEKYLEAGGQTDFLTTTARELISEASKNALEDLSGRTSQKKAGSLSSSVGTVLEEMVNERIGEDKELADALKKGLGEKTAKILLNLQKSKEKPKNMNDYINRASKAISAQFRGDILEIETGVVMARVIDGLVGKRGNVTLTGTVKNAQGKQIKADHTVNINEEISFGISEKNYMPMPDGSVEVSLHSSGSLENFYNLVNNMSINGRNKVNLKSIQKIISKFRQPDFKYHLINQAAFEGTKNIAETDVGKNIIDFVKTCLPLFIGAQFKIKGDTTNVDFFNINGKLIPVSVIMEDVYNNGPLTGQRIGLYSNYQVPWLDMLREKTSNPVENEEYYTAPTTKIGSIQGNKLYKEINVGTIHLKIALANLK